MGTGKRKDPAEGPTEPVSAKVVPTPMGSTEATKFQPLTRVSAAGLK